MIINFIKLTHKTYRLEILNEHQILYKHDLESKSYLRHDIMHFLVESMADLKHSFFGDFKNGVTEDRSEIMMTEKIVSVLQGMDKDMNYSSENYYKKFKEWEIIQKEKLPIYITQDFIENVCKDYTQMLKIWANMKTGETSIMSKNFK